MVYRKSQPPSSPSPRGLQEEGEPMTRGETNGGQLGGQRKMRECLKPLMTMVSSLDYLLQDSWGNMSKLDNRKNRKLEIWSRLN